MKMFIFALLSVVFTAPAASSAEKICTKAADCRTTIKVAIQTQNQAASSGPKWKLSKVGCETASKEQEGNARRCRSYDRQEGGKTPEQCAKCFRQALLDVARQEQCHKNGWAPALTTAQYESLAALGKSFQDSQ